MASIQKLRLKDFVRVGESCHFAVTRAAWPGNPRHTHDFHEIFWIESGKGWHSINTARRELGPRTLVLVRADDQHCLTAASADEPFLIANLAFPQKTWTVLHRTFFPEMADPFRARDIQHREFVINPSGWASLLDDTVEVRGGSRTPATLARLLLNLCYLVQTHHPMEQNAPPWLMRACREIQRPENFAGGTDSFCRLAGRSSAHVARAARRYLSVTPTELVNAARLQWASDQLSATDRSIIEIALDCGFENLGHFYKLFRAARGTSPHQYRLAQQSILRPEAI